MTGQPSTRLSAAILVTRGEGSSFEVYLVRRAPELRFFGGFLALPGGVVDPDDAAGDEVGPDLERGALVCAERELFEETGIALSAPVGELGVGARRELRAALTVRDREQRTEARDRWRRMARGNASLTRLYCITTPPFSPLRYQTVTYHLRLPGGESPSIVPGELVEGEFHAVDEILKKWERGEVWIAPPVVFLLERLRGESLVPGLEQATRAARDFERGKLHPVRFTPGAILLPLLSPTHPPATTTNCLVLGTERIQVIDPAAVEEAERERLVVALEERLREGGRLDNILITHHHPDHIGAVGFLAGRYDVPVAGHPHALERLPRAPGKTRALSDGDVIPLGDAPDGSGPWELQVLHTPGHVEGHLAFRDSRYGTLVAGDLLSTVSTVVIDPGEGHLATYLLSLERLLGEDISLVYPGHGLAHKDGPGLVRYFLAHRKKREDKLLSALLLGGTIEELLATVYDDADPRVHDLARRSLLSGLEKLAEEGRAQKAGTRWEAC
jgi:glyoxylase-like metal-dependent hydrolase (beta-lactamase superfamily II)/8-oxo-dGTP pyrophosphatase MutT (NUDIX family)